MYFLSCKMENANELPMLENWGFQTRIMVEDFEIPMSSKPLQNVV